MSDDQTYLTYSGAPVKALPDGRLSGRIVTFSSSHDPDRVGEFFTSGTDFWLNEGSRRPVLYRHGCDPDLRLKRFGEVQITKAVDGLWCSGFLTDKDPDSLKLMGMARSGQLNFSSGAVAHLVTMTPVGSAKHIDSWPLAEVSLCPKGTVAEPRNVLSLKGFIDQDAAGNFYSLPDSKTPYEVHQRQLEQRAAQLYAESLMLGLRLKMREFERSR